MLPLLIVLAFTVFLLLSNYFLRKNSHSEEDKQKAFWDLENRANATRKKDISKLDYIQIPYDTFPIGKYSDAKVTAIEQELLSLKDLPILNLGTQSNTELKLTYGIANLEILSTCDDRFATLAKLLVSYAQALIEAGHPADAICVLRFGIDCKTDIVSNYTTLAELYQAGNQTDQIKNLYSAAEALDSPRKSVILEKLKSNL